MYRLLLLVSLAGCNLVFGVDHVSPPVDAEPDAPAGPTVVAFDFGITEVVEGSPGTVISSRHPGEGDVTITLDDGTPVTLTPTPDGYTFTRRGAEVYRVTYTSPTSAGSVTYIGNAAELHIVPTVFGRLAREVPPPNTKVTITVTSNTFVSNLFSRGLRALVKANPMVGAYTGSTFDWPAVPSLSGTTGLLRADEGDELFHATYTLGPATRPYYTMYDVAFLPTSLGAAVTTALTMPVPTLVTTSCLDLSARRVREEMRLRDATGAGSVTTSWKVESTLDPTSTVSGGIAIAFEEAIVTADLEQQIMLATPFDGESLIATLGAQAELDIGGVMAVSSSSTTALVPELACTLPHPKLAIEGTTGFAKQISVDGQLADASIDVGDGVIMWDVDGAASWFAIVIHDADDLSVRRYQTAQRSFAVDADVLRAGHRYWIEVTTVSGHPGVATGDFRVLSYPVGSTTVPSRIFTVE